MLTVCQSISEQDKKGTLIHILHQILNILIINLFINKISVDCKL